MPILLILISASSEASVRKHHHKKRHLAASIQKVAEAEPEAKPETETETKTEAASPAPPVETTPIATIRPVEEYQRLLQDSGAPGKKRKKPTLIKLAYESLVHDQYAQAIRLGTQIQKDPMFGDYGYWIAAQAHLEQARESFEKKKVAQAGESAAKASPLILRIEELYPASPFLKSVPKLLAESDRWVGNSACALKKWKRCLEYTEKTYLRLHFLKGLNALEAPELKLYAEGCTKTPSPGCISWLEKLSATYSKKSKEYKAVADPYQSLVEKGHGEKLKIPKVLSLAKPTLAYKAPDLDLTAFDGVMKLYFERKYSAAAKGFRQFLDEFPRSTHRLRARFWLGQALKNSGDKADASKTFLELEQDSALGFYGLLAAQETGQPVESFFPAHLPMAIEDDPALQPIERYHLERAKALIRQKVEPLALFELKEIRPREAFSSYFLVYLTLVNQMARNYPTSFQALGELIQRKFDGIISSYGLRLVFPVEYFDLIKKAAEQQGLDPLLVLSLIKQESAFSEDANSSVGAMGLMQLMPFTAIETDPEVRNAQLLKAERNIQVGTKYLKKLLTRYRWNVAYALAAYNSGPTATDRWIKEMVSREPEGGKGTPQDPNTAVLEFVETIGYRETREYVSGIIRNYYWYSRKLQGSFPKGIDCFWNPIGLGPVPNPIPAESPAPVPELEDATIKQRNGSA